MFIQSKRVQSGGAGIFCGNKKDLQTKLVFSHFENRN
jgi:hypothetical protein